MADSLEYVDFILDKFARLEVVSARRMMGGYVLHMAGKVLGFIFDDEFLFEPGPTIAQRLPNAERTELFPGSKLFYVIDEGMSAQHLCALAEACYDDLPISKPRKSKKSPRSAAAASARRAAEAARDARIAAEFPFAKNIKW